MVRALGLSGSLIVMESFHLTPEVRELLGEDAERDVRSAAMANVPECCECGGEISVAGEETANVRVLLNPASGDMVVHFAHAQCAPSAVVVGHVPAKAIQDAATTLNFTGVLRPAQPALAMLAEPRTPVTLANGRDALTDGLVALGLVAVREPLASCSAPKLSAAWACQLDAGDLVITVESQEFLRYDGMQPEFSDALTRANGLLLLVAADFGLETPDLARIDIVLAAGRAVGGIVTLRA